MLILYHNKGQGPIEIITGNSEKMKLVVREVCKKHRFKTDETWNTNPGTIVLRERSVLGV